MVGGKSGTINNWINLLTVILHILLNRLLAVTLQRVVVM